MSFMAKNLMVVVLIGGLAGSLSAKAPTQTEVGVVTLVHRSPMKLTHQNMNILNGVFLEHPHALAQLKMAAQRAEKLIKELPTLADKKDVVSEKVGYIIALTTEFFDCVKPYKGMVKPLLQESLQEMYPTSRILDAIENSTDAKLYLVNKVQTKNELNALCVEIVRFFNDMSLSFSKETQPV